MLKYKIQTHYHVREFLYGQFVDAATVYAASHDCTEHTSVHSLMTYINIM